MAKSRPSDSWSHFTNRLLVIGLTLLVGGAVSASAVRPASGLARIPDSNGDSSGGAAPQIVARRLVAAHLASVPAPPAVVEIGRASFPPAESIAVAAQPGPVAIYVDAGAITVTTSGTATVTRAIVPGSGAKPEPQPATGSIDLRYGDHLMAMEGAAFDAVNKGRVRAVLLIARVVTWTSTAVPPLLVAVDSPVTWKVLAAGIAREMPLPPAMLVMTRVVYAIGSADLDQAENYGPLLIAIEAGTIGYDLTMGTCAVVRNGTEIPVRVLPGEEETLLAGDYVVEQWGAISAQRNLGDERAWVLVTTLVRAPERAVADLGVATEPSADGKTEVGA